MKKIIIGLMSGMSMDGVDLSCAEISGEFPDLNINVLGTYFHPYEKSFKARLIKGQEASVSEVSKLNFLVAQEFAKCVSLFLQENKLSASSIDYIGSHGQTLYHDTNHFPASSLQVGSPSIIAELTGIQTIGNFRVRDIAAGGNGAPLVSLADFILFRDPKEVLALNNLGSISNVTLVTPKIEDMLSFDTGPANVAIDFYARKFIDQGIDHGGQLAQTGSVIPKLLKELMAIEFFNHAPPRAAGYDEFGPSVLNHISQSYLNVKPCDLLRTAVEFSAQTIAQSYRNYLLPKFPKLQRAIFSGGGTHNKTLMKRIAECLPEIKIETLSSKLSDSKEALAFAILAYESLAARPGSFSSTTGIRRPTILGERSF